jgi:hypothetical protein
MKFYIIYFLSLINVLAFSQTATLMTNGIAVGSPNGVIRIFDPITEAQRKFSTTEDLAEVRGSHFWDNEWSQAMIVLQDGRQARLKRVKLDQYTSEVHFIQNNSSVELIAKHGIIKQVAFFDRKDSTQIKAVFEVLILEPKTIDSYCQVLNSGKKQLLKRTIVKVEQDGRHSAISAPDTRFVPKIDYYLRDGLEVTNIKGINKNSVGSVIPLTNEEKEWLSSHKNKLKNETDLVDFLNYLNTSK